MPSGQEEFSNPLAPEGHLDEPLSSLTNDDFRKLMMTPRVPSAGTAKHGTKEAEAPKPAEKKTEKEDAANKRRQKKMFFAKIKKQEEERAEELRSKYRDRAAERRENSTKDYDPLSGLSTTADYRAVAPTMDGTYAERRKKIIQESKYLGGDMEHTHLVKGLDYALLDKVRAEISNAEQEKQDDELEEAMKEHLERTEDVEVEAPQPQPDTLQFRTRMAKNIYKTLFQPDTVNVSDLFLPRRMAYVVDLEDDFMESDIPTTLMRSKADCPNAVSTTTLSTNDIVISKLTQILSYLRQGRRDKKNKKKEKTKIRPADDVKLKPGPEDSIYGDIGDYDGVIAAKASQKEKEKPSRHKEDQDERRRDRPERERGHDRADRGDRDYRDRGRHHHDRRPGHDQPRQGHEQGRQPHEQARPGHDQARPGHDRQQARERGRYFEKPAEDEPMEPRKINAQELVKTINEKYASVGWSQAEFERNPGSKGSGREETKKKKQDDLLKQLKQKSDADGYAECYPGMMEMVDATGDSDDEVDFTKMDQGNKKGPVGRWDFDTQEAYSAYMSQREALPKAAFQYGVKMADGRKTRRTGPKDEKAALDRQWQKIQNIMNKRKDSEQGGGASKAAKF